MKEIYDWVVWFEELAGKIANGGEQYLIDKAKLVVWTDNEKAAPLLRYGDENIDPFSFFYTLASQSARSESRKRVYPKIIEAFDMTGELDLDSDDAFIFPIPPPVNTLFHRASEGKSNPSLLWTLFRDAVSGFESVKPDNFESALKIPGVATRNLTQTLFLINPKDFMPIDDQMKSLGFFDSVPKHISWEEYRQRINQVRDGFPGCHLYEANLFAYLSARQLRLRANTCFQISTNVYNDNKDHWDDFEMHNYVYTGGPGKDKEYPLDEPQPGDVILVRFGRTEGRGIGIVYKNDYQGGFDEDHRLHVLWLNKTHATLSKETPVIGFSSAKKTIEAFRQTKEYALTFELLDQLGNNEKTEEDLPPKELPPLNRILYGPPGTGKTWRATALALEIIDGVTESPELDLERFQEIRFNPDLGTGQIAMVTFHQNFAYEDFVEGIRPVLKNENNLTYEMRAGIFKRIVESAKNRPNERFVLIIDEINRGNIAKIFGELITLIEDSRRVGRTDETHVTLPYSGDLFGVPGNIFIIGTMNTTDRSIQLLDTALRRRFTFIEAMPDPEHEGICRDIDGIDCTKMLKTLNERVTALLDREHQIGHTYLLGVDEIGKLSEAFRNSIFPLLQEYFFDDWAKIRAILGYNAFITERKIENLSFESDLVDEHRVIYERLHDADPAWEEPEQYRKVYDLETTDEPEDI